MRWSCVVVPAAWEMKAIWSEHFWLQTVWHQSFGINSNGLIVGVQLYKPTYMQYMLKQNWTKTKFNTLWNAFVFLVCFTNKIEMKEG